MNNTLRWSDEVYRIFGLQPQEFGATYEAFLEAVYPDDRGAVDAAYSKSLHEGLDNYEIEHRVLRKSTGETRYVYEKCEHIRDATGKIVRSAGMVHDITDRKLVELELKRSVDELAAANKELETFSYSVSHDLRAPLRTMRSFAEIIMADHSSGMDEQGKGFLSQIIKSSGKMDDIINALLNFSMIGKQELHKDRIDMKELTMDTFDELRTSVPERKVQFTVGDLSPAEGDRTLIRQVLSNLLGNAMKFTSKRQIAEIEVGGRVEGGENIYYVKDNGAGFDMKFAEKVFEPFRRVHNKQEFGGSGLGLSIVKRIISRHGGKVWAEGELDKGAIFYFTLPATAGGD